MYCLDTDITIEYLKNNPSVVSKVNLYFNELCITPITVLELFYGAYRSSQVEKHIAQVQELRNNLNVLTFTLLVYEQFGKTKAQLKEEGKIIDNFDLIISCFCKAYGCILVTNNTKHFERIEGLKLENWMKD